MIARDANAPPLLSADGLARAARESRPEKQPGHCAHCGQLILGPGTDAGKEGFCCEGCRTVHAWLGEAKLERYYDLMAQSGRAAPQAFAGKGYNEFLQTLDDPALLKSMGRWREGRHAVNLECPEITCAGCGWILEKVLQGRPGVITFDVDFLHGEAHLEYDSAAAGLRGLLAIPASLGYRLKPKSSGEPDRPALDRGLLFRLAVSGACFANSMAFALAGYLGAFRGMPAEWMRFFAFAGFALSVPAVAYAAYPFYSGAAKALRGGRFNIDVTISIGILISFGLSAYSLAARGGAGFSDSLTGLIFFLLLGRWALRRFEAGLTLKGRWFEVLKPGRTRVVRQGKADWIECDQVVPGDWVEILNGDYAPLDGMLQSPDAWMDTSLLTGESRPARLLFGDTVFAGYRNLSGRINVRAAKTTGANRVDALSRELERLVSGRRSLPDGVGATAKWFTLAVAFCAMVSLALHLREGIAGALASAASVFIISCSCALALAAPISRGLGLKRARTLGFHFRSQSGLEALGTTRCVLFDKTGTLTFMRRMVSEWVWTGAAGHPDRQGEILAALRTLSRQSLHPVAQSLALSLESTPDGSWRFAGAEEIPHFGLLGRFFRPDGAGAEKSVALCLCRYGAWTDPEGPFRRLGYAIPTPPGIRKTAGNDSCLFADGVLVAVIGFTDEIKPDVPALVAGLRERGIEPVLLSGDNAAKVDSFAAACGFRSFHAGLTPEAKGKLAQEYRARYGGCLAVGDGFNDNLLFGASDMAMAIHGGAVDRSQGTDILFTGARPSDLLRVFALGGQVKRSIRASFWVSGIYNAMAIAVAMGGGVTPLFAAVLMPLSGLSLCAVALALVHGREVKGRAAPVGSAALAGAATG